jgi:phospholipid transport system substrate-binding protein
MPTDLTRRSFAALAASALVAATLARPAAALTVDQAKALVDTVTGEINKVINSGASSEAMYAAFQDIFTRYADVNYIALSALGPAGRTATPAQKAAFTKAFSRYLAVKYGKRFREFVGGQIEVTGAKPVKTFFEVQSVAKLQGQAPFDVRFQVFEKDGKQRFFNIVIEGVNMLSSERAEIGALLDKNGGNIDAMIAQLKG